MSFFTPAGCAWNSTRSSVAMETFGAIAEADTGDACGSASDFFAFAGTPAFVVFVFDFVPELLAAASLGSGSVFEVDLGCCFFLNAGVSASSAGGFFRGAVSAAACGSDANARHPATTLASRQAVARNPSAAVMGGLACMMMRHCR